MENYKQLALKYLKLNRKRSILTICGVVVAVTILYAMLNLGWCKLLSERDRIRAVQDYELVFLTENESQMKQIMADDRVESAYVGPYYAYDYNGSKFYESAIYINTTNPYFLNSIQEKMEETYGVESEMNMELAWTYVQGSEGSATAIIILAALLVCCIFAIFGVGIVRNSIQLSTLEQIKDYGNLRCIGATKGELKSIVYIEGCVLEISGMIIGIMTGFLASFILGHVLKWKVDFHFISIVPIFIAFLGDLYFVMQDNCKKILQLSPVSAIRGEYRIQKRKSRFRKRKEKMKAQKQSIFGKLFGIEGDYAYKNIMRNPGRFYKTVAALGIGMGVFIAISGVVTVGRDIIKTEQEQWKYYQVYFENKRSVMFTRDETLSVLPPIETLERIRDLDEVSSAKRIYSTQIALKDRKQALLDHYTDEFLEKTSYGQFIVETWKEETQKVAETVDVRQGVRSEVTCYGYDEEDYKRYESVLVDGTLDVSENGLVLVNGGRMEEVMQDYTVSGYFDVTFTDYKVGDTIEFLDMAKLQELMGERIEQLNQEYETEKERILANREGAQLDADTDEKLRGLNSDSIMNKLAAYQECRQILIENGDYKTYTIEGIVREDVNHCGDALVFILPLDRYFDFTASTEEDISGMQYHFDKYYSERYRRAALKEEYSEAEESSNYYYEESLYPELMDIIEQIQSVILWIMLFVLFIVTMSAFNIINTTASNLYLRRKEFAQLRVLGVSKRGLMKMVMLEGVIASIAANLVGILIGVILDALSVGMILSILMGYDMKFPWLAAVIGGVISICILCGSIYVPLRGLRQDVAIELAMGGD